MTPETVYQRFRKKRITTVTRLEYDNRIYHTIIHISALIHRLCRADIT